VNGRLKFKGGLAAAGQKKAFAIDKPYFPAD